ncbi:MAG: hypothetical protein ACREL4_05065 [Gemmatimonadales bacterium]
MTHRPQSSPGPRRLPACSALRRALLFGVAAAFLPGIAAAQEPRTLARESRIYATPGGASLGLITKGSTLASRRVNGTAIELQIDGWIFARSVGGSSRDGFDLEVTQAGGQNLRASAASNARIVARLARGALLQKVEADGHGWVHVRRFAWVPTSSLRPLPALAAPTAQGASPPVTPAPSGHSAPSASTSSSAPAKPLPIVTLAPSDREQMARASTLTVVPDGATAASVTPGAEVQVVTRAGDWTQVSVTGWVKTADLAPMPDQALVGVSAAEVRANPAQYVGRILEWRLQLVAIMVADELRPEIPAGRTYLLTRGPLPEAGFVYVVVPPDQVARFQKLEPLKALTLRVQVRAASTKYLPNPVVDLLQVVAGG